MNFKLLTVCTLLMAVFTFSCGSTAQDSPQQNGSSSDTKKHHIPERTKKGGENIRPIEGGKDKSSVQRVGFYNVENLFDTKDAPKKDDKDFTPNGRNHWKEKMYQKKLKNLAKVIDYMGEPGIMGLAEVENRKVLEDLVSQNSIQDAKYDIAHKESPDHRGIDVALLYSTDEYEKKDEEVIRIDFPRSIVTNYTTRDILHVTLQNKDKEYIHVFVNHWPSRRGGVKASEPKRTYVAKQVRKEVDKIFKKYDNNHVILIGDFNDGTRNKSIVEVLDAQGDTSNPQAEKLYDLTDALAQKGLGTHNYGGEWNMLDHIIVSGSLLDKKGLDMKNTKVFNRKWMLFYHKKSKQHRPNRTFSGGKYYGGFSDHLPVSAEIVKL